jgi:RHS repeat-associated protein
VEFSGGSLSVEASAAYTGQGQVERVVNANGHAVEAEYDTNGLVRLVAPETGPCVWAGYDAEGRLIEVGRVPERSAFDPDNPPAPLLSAQRDGLGRVIRVTYADNGYESLEHDPLGRVTRVVDRAGRETRVEWLPIGIVTRVTRDATGLAAQVQWLYDQQAQGLTVKDELGRVVESYSLDLQGRAVGVTNAAGQVMSVDYGVADWITSLTRFDGSTVNANYDQLGRLSQVVYPDDTLTLTYGTRRLLTRVADSAGAIEAEYDGLNRVTALTGLGPAGRVSYGRLPAGQVSGMTSVVGVVVYSYDAAERLTRVEQASQGFTYTYNGTNGLLAAVTPDTGGAREMRSYDELDRLSVLTWSEPSSNTLVGLSYQYNLVGLITNLMDATGAAKAYAYDSLDRLISERWREPGGQVVYEAAYGYDLAGNRTQSVVNGRTAAYAYGVGNRLASWSTNSFQAFDGAGNVTNLQYYDGRTLGLDWDSRYRLREVRTNGVLAERYGYDSLDRRAWVSDGVETNYLVYDGDEVIADVGPDGTIMRSYLYGPGIDNILSMTVHGPTTSVYYYVKDHLGSVQAIVDASGAVVESYQYDAWGSVLNVLDSSGNPIQNRQSQIQNRFLWQGREYSWKTGLYYFRTRWYEPVTGRWLSQDAIGIAGGLNQYVFCADSPVNFVDPFGLDWFDNLANFFAGAGDVLSFGATRKIRDAFPEYYMQDYSSGSYKGGEWTGMGYSLTLGGGRLAYAGAAKGGSMFLLRQGATAANTAKAVRYRNALKTGFNLGMTSKGKMMTMAKAWNKYEDYAEIIRAAGRTATGAENALFKIPYSWNLLGGYFFAAGAKETYEQSSECK